MFSFTKNNQQPPPQPPMLGGDEFTPPQQQPQQTLYTQYNPLKDLENTNFRNPFGNSKVYQLPTSVEYLFEEDAYRPGRGFSENLCFCTGTSLLAGCIVGGVKGTFEGLKAAERGDSLKIRVSRVLNSGGFVGRRIGNKAGVLGLLYSGIGGGIKVQRGGVDDDIGCLLAGVGTGTLFGSCNGVRAAAVGGIVGGALVAGYLGGKFLVDRCVPSLSFRT